MHQVENPFLRFRLPAVMLAAVTAAGMAGYTVIEHWSLLDSFYMVIITISTVGFTEVHPLSTAGRLFTTALIVSGVGTMLYAFGVFAETMSEGHFFEYRRARRMESALARLRDHYIVCGYGRTGSRVCYEFEQRGVPFVVIDNNPEAIQRLRNENRPHLEGDAAAEEVLKGAGVEHARGLISAVDSDERSVYITLSARAMRPDLHIVARAGQASSVRRLQLAGADRIVSPYLMAGHRMAEFAIHPELEDKSLVDEALAPLLEKEDREAKPPPVQPAQ